MTTKPLWMRKRLMDNETLKNVHQLLRRCDLHTVCEEAPCPNLGECFSKGTSTFMILGNRCTRNCTFCAVEHGKPQKPDAAEPERVAKAVFELKLCYVVITSVTRDDLSDGGAGFFAETIRAIKALYSAPLVEALIPDFKGSEASLKTVVDAKPDVINHNIETIARLYPGVRPQANYKRSLDLLKAVKHMDDAILTKSGFMLGLGEKTPEVIQTMRDLHDVGCDILTIGQYLSPSPAHYPIVEYVPPGVFSGLAKRSRAIGFRAVASGPFVRSSYFARDVFASAEGS